MVPPSVAPPSGENEIRRHLQGPNIVLGSTWSDGEGEQVQGVARRQTYASNTTIRGESEEEVFLFVVR